MTQEKTLGLTEIGIDNPLFAKKIYQFRMTKVDEICG